MTARISFADLLRAGADKDKQRGESKPAPSIPSVSQPAAPEKDFSKMPNSVKRAVEDGKFPNSSLAVYLYLYSLTRGAIQPKRSVRINKPNLLAGVNLRSEKALLNNLSHLKNIGLVKITVFNGTHLGNEFEVFVPEEIWADLPTYLPTYLPTSPTYLPTYLPTDKKTVGRRVQTIENKDTCGNAKTIFKNLKNDDEPAALFESDNKVFSGMIGETKEELEEVSLSDAKLSVIEKAISEVSKKIIGRGLKSTDDVKLRELAELLVMELEIAAARTDSISSVPAFLTEHLRRRLLGKPSFQNQNKTFDAKYNDEFLPEDKTVRSAQDASVVYQAEPLTKQARETVLKTMRDYIAKGQSEFVMSLQNTYTADDWEWLSGNLSPETQKSDKRAKKQKLK